VHPNDEGSPTPGRPSPSSASAPGEAPRPRVVGGLDRIDGAVSPFTSPARFPWALSGALLLAIGASAMLWSGDDGEKQIIRAATVTAVPEPPAPAAVAAAWQDAAPDDERPVPLMVQVSPRPAPAPAADGAAAAAPVKASSARPASAGRSHAMPVPRRHAVPAARRQVPPRQTRPARKTPRVPAPVRAVPVSALPVALSPSERDVALVAAVVTRTKAAQAGPSALALKWRQCAAASSVAAARHCREQLCSGHGDSVAECKGGK